MARPKLSLASDVLTSRSSQRPPQASSISSADDLAVVRIAERFAPATQSTTDTDDRVFDQKMPPPAAGLGSRGLVVALFVVAVLPTLFLGAMLGLGVVRVHLPAIMDFGGEPSPRGVPVTDARSPTKEQPKSAEALPVALAAPAMIEAKAGEHTSLALALSRTDALPTRSIVAIEGLPHGSILSSGRPYGEGGWNLRSDEIDNLRLVLPKAAAGKATLQIRVLTPSGEEVASAETLLKVIPQTDSSDPAEASEQNEPATALNAGIQPFVTDKTQQAGYDTMLAFGANSDGLVTSPAVELSAAPTADRLQGSAPNHGTPRPNSPEDLKVQDGPARAQANPAPPQNDDAQSRIVLTEFVNLREAPSSSSRVIGVMDKHSELRVVGRKRAWLKVTDATNSQTGWIYSRYAASPTGSRRTNGEALPSTLGSSRSDSDADSSFWTRVGRWLVGP